MTPSSSDWATKPVPIKHLHCGEVWDQYSAEWPPKVIVCPGCGTKLQLVGHDKSTKNTSYRRI